MSDEIPVHYEDEKLKIIHQLLFPSYDVIEEEPSHIDDDEEMETDGIFNEEDRLILMHRDAHFGASFSVMHDYYKKDKKGAVLPHAVKRIHQLEQLEKEMKRDLAPLLLTGSSAEKVACAKKMYEDLANQKDPKNILTQIAQFILSENEVEEDAKNIIQHKGIGPYLIEILHSPFLVDPLFPGYGKAPISAAYALGILKEPAAIPALFLLLAADDFDLVTAAQSALVSIGEPAKKFLLHIVEGTPITKDHELAMQVLLSFEQTKELSYLFLKILKNLDIKKYQELACYLVIGLGKLDAKGVNEFLEFEKTHQFPQTVQREIELLKKQFS